MYIANTGTITTVGHNKQNQIDKHDQWHFQQCCLHANIRLPTWSYRYCTQQAYCISVTYVSKMVRTILEE